MLYGAQRPFGDREADEQTIAAWAKKHDVARRTVFYWQASPKFIEALNKLTEMVMEGGNYDHLVWGNLVALSSADVEANALYWKLRGKLAGSSDGATVQAQAGVQNIIHVHLDDEGEELILER